jgi:PKD repeat protein
MDGGAGVGYWGRLRAVVLAGAVVFGLLGTASGALADSPSFTTTPSSPQINQQVTFTPGAYTPSDGGTITQYLWDFGDGQTGSSSPTSGTPSNTQVQHAYSRGGQYTVTLTVVDSQGGTAQSTQQIGVIGPPTAAFNPTSATVQAGSNVAFDGTQSSDPDGSISAYSWNFGDGTTSNASQPVHAFTEPGTYNVTLSVTDNHGGSASVTHQITVITPPPIQTLVESIIPAPILIKFGSPTVIGHALVDLKERLFCPGTGPSCLTTITETKTGLARDRRGVARAAAAAVLTTRPNGNAELGLHLSAAQWKGLLRSHHLSLALKLVSTRGGEKVTSTLRLRLVRKG